MVERYYEASAEIDLEIHLSILFWKRQQCQPSIANGIGLPNTGRAAVHQRPRISTLPHRLNERQSNAVGRPKAAIPLPTTKGLHDEQRESGATEFQGPVATMIVDGRWSHQQSGTAISDLRRAS